MSIGRRFINMARSELNSLLEKAAELGTDDRDADATDDGDAAAARDSAPRARTRPAQGVDLHALSDAELQAELARRERARRQEDARARVEREAAEFERSRREQRARADRPAPPPQTPGPGDPLRKAYAALEVPYGSDFDVVKKSYRTLMRKYHPDRHTGSPDKQKAAHELTTKLTDAYRRIEEQLRR